MLGMGVLLAGTAAAQMRSIDPNQGIDQDLSTAASRAAAARAARSAPVPADDRVPDQSRPDQSSAYQSNTYQPGPDQRSPDQPPVAPSRAGEQARADATTQAADTYRRDDLLAAGEGVFGKGAEGLAGIIERILKDQGQPNAYIAGHEASGAFVVGLRYGSGILSHKIEGQQPVYWTGPSVGFDVGGDANKVFVLVYNLYDTGDLYHRFPGAEGRLYLVGGFAATYLRRGNIVVIPIRLGVGWRAGVNVNYMKFSHKSKLLPF
ncbi:DUF1134 domain-containing protein [Sphingomonas bacterium]|uniref:DUF1134 domain-containing protein n=1 Tax=Sphingomonas bacterium TaxID=1895847 RepID=UPI00157559CA|nr:DUF1134 domain-containing protein [Sphingomonas bacterium]